MAIISNVCSVVVLLTLSFLGSLGLCIYSSPFHLISCFRVIVVKIIVSHTFGPFVHFASFASPFPLFHFLVFNFTSNFNHATVWFKTL